MHIWSHCTVYIIVPTNIEIHGGEGRSAATPLMPRCFSPTWQTLTESFAWRHAKDVRLDHAVRSTMDDIAKLNRHVNMGR